MTSSKSSLIFANKLQGKRVVLVGGSSGIGFAVAQAVLEFEASVVIASSSQTRVDDAVQRLSATIESNEKQTINGYALDLAVGSVKEIESRLEEFLIKQVAGQFDYYIHTAGEFRNLVPLEHIDFEEAQSFFNVRYWGSYAAAKLIKKHDLIRAGGCIILTTGVSIDHPPPGLTMGASVGGAIVALVRALAVDMAPNVRVCGVSPGPVLTELWNNVVKEPAARQALISYYETKTLTGHIAMPEETAEAYLYYMRDSSATGQILTTDGGFLLK